MIYIVIVASNHRPWSADHAPAYAVKIERIKIMAEEDLQIRKCLDCGKVWKDVPPIGYCPDCSSENIEEAAKDEL